MDMGTFTIGRIAGIRIRLSWSFFAVFLLVVWALAENVFPERNANLSDATYIAMGLIGGLLFFGSVLVHELGHALQARREGLEVDGITLWLLGGVAAFKGDYPGPWSELRVAAAGSRLKASSSRFVKPSQVTTPSAAAGSCSSSPSATPATPTTSETAGPAAATRSSDQGPG